MKYYKLVMRGDVAQIYPETFMKHMEPANRAEALERVNHWNKLVAEDVIKQGFSNAEVFYYLEVE